VKRLQIARRLLSLLRPLAPLMTVSATARIVNQGLGVAIPALAAALIVNLDSGGSPANVILLLAALALVKGVFRYIEQFTGHAVAFQLLSTLRVDVYRWVVPLAPAGLEEDRTGDLVNRVIGDVDRVEPFYAHTIAPLASAVMVPLLTALGVAVWIDPVVAAVFIAFPLLIVLVVPWISASRVATLAAVSRRESGEAAAAMTDAVQGAREVAVFSARERIMEQLDNGSQRASAVRNRLARIGSIRVLAGELLAGVAVIVVTAVAAARFSGGAIDLPAVAAAIVVAWVGTTPAKAMQDIVPDLDQALAAAGRLLELSDRPPPIPSLTKGAERPEDGSVGFEDVTVWLPSAGARVVDGISIDVPAGSYTAIVGPSGSGKSTLVELLARFRDPVEGRVTIGGCDVRDMSSQVLRSHVTLVPQRPDIFFGTIGDNLRLAHPEATDAQLWDALEGAALTTWVAELPDRLQTPIGELGETLSGGQRQRIAIARAFLRPSPILILDEATSELDPQTERRILQRLVRERGSRTVLVVAHRMETVTDADLILVLDGGRLAEHGGHAGLLQIDGVYAGLWRRHLDVADQTL
jgi:ATP-binding cassette, subfamily C, bacterial CydC